MGLKVGGLELRHLRYFEAVARHLSFSRAAEELHVAQPVLSRQIKDLEEFVGATLFDRNRVRVRLTSAGDAFREQIGRVLTQVDIAITAAQQAAKELAAELIIGDDWRFTHPLITRAIMALKDKNPKMEVTLHDLSRPEQVEALKKGEIHVGFFPLSKIPAEGFLGQPFATVRMVAVLGCSHPLAKKQQLKAIDLKDETWLIIDGGMNANSYRSFISRMCKEFLGFVPRKMRRAKSRDGILNLAALGEGICVLPEYVLPKDNAMLKIYPLPDLKPVELCAVYKFPAKSQPLKDFLEILKKMKE
jgi:DNA-binding transcriptional LysR family regulator